MATKKAVAGSEYVKGINSDLKMVTVEWVKCAQDNPDEFKGTKKWCMDVLLSESLAKALKDKGFNVKANKEGKDYIRPHKKCMVGAKPQIAPKFVGRDGKTEVDPAIVGNGSVVNVKVFCKKYPETEFVSMFIDKVQVVNLVEYGANEFDAIPEDVEEY